MTATKTKRSLTVVAREGKSVLGLLIRTERRIDGYWLKIRHNSIGEAVTIRWQHETDAGRVYTVAVASMTCTCPARKECRHVAATKRLIQLGVVK